MTVTVDHLLALAEDERNLGEQSHFADHVDSILEFLRGAGPYLQQQRQMPPPLNRTLAALSDWIDTHPANHDRDREAVLWGRVAKVSEEAGEAIAALVGLTGQNPRKGVHGDLDDLQKELLDVAVTALAAVEHLNANAGLSMGLLAAHVERLRQRADLAVSS